MELDVDDAAPDEELQPIDTAQKQGQAMSREIADSDAEDDALDIDDEKPKRTSTVTPATQESIAKSEGTVGSNAPLQFEEDCPSSSFVEPAPVSPTDKSSEQSGSNIHHLHEEADPEPSAIQVGTTESLSMVDDEQKTNTAENAESFDQMNGTEPKSSLSKADRRKDLNQHTEDSGGPGDRPEPQAVEAESSQKATAPGPFGPPVGSNQAQDIVAGLLEDPNALKEVPSALTTTQFEETVLARDTAILDVPRDDTRMTKSPDLPSVEASKFDPFESAATPTQEALTEVRNGAHTASQNQNEVEAIPASSSSDKACDALSSDATEQPEVGNLGISRAEQTPEQKRTANLQTRNTTLTQTLMSLTQQRTALLHCLSTHLSPYTLADIPSVLKPYRGKTVYTPSIAAHTTPLPAPIPPEDDAKLMAEARLAIKDHIGRLHRYNEIRDVGQGLIGMIADQRGRRIVDCMDEFGVEVGD
ncbi:hypothetical protein EG328_001529 [Venturia inaequalis]|uniref:Uncharacterized protein n=1 Tax=Venturia inaequalis TaxID=5025 RepID=A0A8H3Z3A8_VENIN|nr:hypothetical protein EG328_001529 [Venturia inaequalis]KAE9991519.1 hypothetical protein EG327_011539 [Venturia inaequalis]